MCESVAEINWFMIDLVASGFKHSYKTSSFVSGVKFAGQMSAS
jgi:hypothetical protein